MMAVGVLLETFVVRPVLIPALVDALRRRGRLAGTPRLRDEPASRAPGR